MVVQAPSDRPASRRSSRPPVGRRQPPPPASSSRSASSATPTEEAQAVMDLNATPGAPTANAYVTVAAASAYLETRLYIDAWFGTETRIVSIATREQALIWATALLDQHVRWYGQPATLTQALAWPMAGQVDHLGRPVPVDVVPVVIQQATATYALALLGDPSAAAETQAPPGIKSRRLGDTEVVYQDQDRGTTSPVSQTIPADVRALLRPYGTMTGNVQFPCCAREGCAMDAALQAMLTDQVTYQRYLSQDGYGAPVFATGIVLPARIEYKLRRIVTAQGRSA